MPVPRAPGCRSSENTRYAGVWALAEVAPRGDRAALWAVCARLGDPDEEVRGAANFLFFKSG